MDFEGAIREYLISNVYNESDKTNDFDSFTETRKSFPMDDLSSYAKSVKEYMDAIADRNANNRKQIFQDEKYQGERIYNDLVEKRISIDITRDYSSIYLAIKNDDADLLITLLGLLSNNAPHAVYLLSNSLPASTAYIRKKRLAPDTQHHVMEIKTRKTRIFIQNSNIRNNVSLYMPPAFYAVMKKSVNCIREIIKCGVSPLIKCYYFDKPLMLTGYVKAVHWARNHHTYTPKSGIIPNEHDTLLSYAAYVDGKTHHSHGIVQILNNFKELSAYKIPGAVNYIRNPKIIEYWHGGCNIIKKPQILSVNEIILILFESFIKTDRYMQFRTIDGESGRFVPIKMKKIEYEKVVNHLNKIPELFHIKTFKYNCDDSVTTHGQDSDLYPDEFSKTINYTKTILNKRNEKITDNSLIYTSLHSRRAHKSSTSAKNYVNYESDMLTAWGLDISDVVICLSDDEYNDTEDESMQSTQLAQSTQSEIIYGTQTGLRLYDTKNINSAYFAYDFVFNPMSNNENNHNTIECTFSLISYLVAFGLKELFVKLMKVGVIEFTHCPTLHFLIFYLCADRKVLLKREGNTKLSNCFPKCNISQKAKNEFLEYVLDNIDEKDFKSQVNYYYEMNIIFTSNNFINKVISNSAKRSKQLNLYLSPMELTNYENTVTRPDKACTERIYVTPIHIAELCCDLNITKILMRRGFYVNSHIISEIHSLNTESYVLLKSITFHYTIASLMKITMIDECCDDVIEKTNKLSNTNDENAASSSKTPPTLHSTYEDVLKDESTCNKLFSKELLDMLNLLEKFSTKNDAKHTYNDVVNFMR